MTRSRLIYDASTSNGDRSKAMFYLSVNLIIIHLAGLAGAWLIKF